MCPFDCLTDIEAHAKAFWEACQTPYHLTLALLAFVLFCWLWIRLRQNRRSISLAQGENGKIRVSAQALEGLVNSACTGGIVAGQPKIRFCMKGNRLNVCIRLKLTLTHPVANAAEILQTRITEVLQTNLGEAVVGNVNILITGFSKDGKEASRLSPLLDSLDTHNRQE